jgi:hypothetical protein
MVYSRNKQRTIEKLKEEGTMISKEEYVAMLKAMLEVEKPCHTCPGYEGFENWDKLAKQGEFISIRKGWGSGMVPDIVNFRICQELCRPFINLEFNSYCPCVRLGRVAIQRAHLAIEAYQNGTHPWCITTNEQSKS